tara:strand:- start:4551 stop:5354 length:804 start_codon:yes stop_codon:yes gene_type:complete
MKLVEYPKESLVLGTIRHKFYEDINTIEKEIVVSIKKGFQYEDVLEMYTEQYKNTINDIIDRRSKALFSVDLTVEDAKARIMPFVIKEAKSRAENVIKFIIGNNVFGLELWEKLTPKIHSEVKIKNSNLKLSGIIDQIHVFEQGSVPFELKTGKAPSEGVWPGHKIQVAAYSMLLESHLGEPVREGFVRYLDAGVERQVSMNPKVKDDVLKLTKEVSDLMNSTTLPGFCENKNKCSSCGLKDDCYDELKMGALVREKFGNEFQKKLS